MPKFWEILLGHNMAPTPGAIGGIYPRIAGSIPWRLYKPCEQDDTCTTWWLNQPI